jgi:hypothetical protein
MIEREDEDQREDEGQRERERGGQREGGGDAVDADAPDELRESLVQMRQEADRIATLGTGTEQVEAAERFAEDAGRLDEQVGAAARDADADRDS